MLVPNIQLLGRPREGALTVPVTSIQPNPDQPRKLFDESKLKELASSIEESGDVQQEIVVRLLPTAERTGTPFYQIITGERRWRAAQLAGLSHVPVRVERHISELDADLLSGIENLQRVDLTPTEEAAYYLRLQQKHNLKGADIARKLGVSTAKISIMLRVARLADESEPKLTRIYAAFASGSLSLNAAYEALVAAESEDEPDRTRAGRPRRVDTSSTPLQQREHSAANGMVDVDSGGRMSGTLSSVSTSRAQQPPSLSDSTARHYVRAADTVSVKGNPMTLAEMTEVILSFEQAIIQQGLALANIASQHEQEELTKASHQLYMAATAKFGQERNS